MTGYQISIENGWENLPEVFPLYATHYREMQERLASEGMDIPPFNPRIDAYVRAWQSGELINYIVRDEDGAAVGYSNVYLAHDMHNSEMIAQEDTIFVLKPHRRGVGRRLTRFILDDLRARGVKRAFITTATDLRVAKMLTRLGFQHTAHAMTYFF